MSDLDKEELIATRKLHGLDDDLFKVEKEVNENSLKIYAKYFQTNFKHIFNKSNKYIKIVLYPMVKGIYSIFELIISDNKNDEIIEIKNRFNKNINDFERIKNKINFEEDSFFIIKTRELKNWNLEAAKLDLEKVLSEIVSGAEVGGEEDEASND